MSSATRKYYPTFLVLLMTFSLSGCFVYGPKLDIREAWGGPDVYPGSGPTWEGEFVYEVRFTVVNDSYSHSAFCIRQAAKQPIGVKIWLSETDDLSGAHMLIYQTDSIQPEEEWLSVGESVPIELRITIPEADYYSVFRAHYSNPTSMIIEAYAPEALPDGLRDPASTKKNSTCCAYSVRQIVWWTS